MRVVSFAAKSVALSNGYMLARDLRLFVCLFRCVPCWAPRESLAEFQCVRIVRDQIGSFLLVMIARDLIIFRICLGAFYVGDLVNHWLSFNVCASFAAKSVVFSWLRLLKI